MQMHSAGPKEAWLGSSTLSTPFLSPRQHSTSHLYRTESLKGHFKDLEETRTEKDSPGEFFDIVVMDSTLWGLEVSPQKDVLGRFPESWQEVARARLPL
jgi:hypothetical protein